MGWKVNSPGVPLRGGSLATKPEAREDALFPAVPQASAGWAKACASFAGEDGARLQLTVTAEGTIASAKPLGEDRLSRCVAERAQAGQLMGVKLPSETTVSLRLMFKKTS